VNGGVENGHGAAFKYSSRTRNRRHPTAGPRAQTVLVPGACKDCDSRRRRGAVASYSIRQAISQADECHCITLCHAASLFLQFVLTRLDSKGDVSLPPQAGLFDASLATMLGAGCIDRSQSAGNSRIVVRHTHTTMSPDQR
jgi:hypothetical protein